jgi:hypothetical protein
MFTLYRYMPTYTCMGSRSRHVHAHRYFISYISLLLHVYILYRWYIVMLVHAHERKHKNDPRNIKMKKWTWTQTWRRTGNCTWTWLPWARTQGNRNYGLGPHSQTDSESIDFRWGKKQHLYGHFIRYRATGITINVYSKSVSISLLNCVCVCALTTLENLQKFAICICGSIFAD